MAKTKSEMFTLIGTNLPDNTTGLITPAAVREVMTQLADSALYAAAGMKEVEIMTAAATADQAPTVLSTPLQLVFGAAQNSAVNPVMVSAAGVLTFNTAGVYSVRVRLQCGRVAATGVATVAFRALLGGVQYGNSSAVRLDNALTILPVDARFVVNATAGQTMYFQIVRDSVGSSINAGGVYATALATSGWGTTPSALLVVSRLEPV